jgi:hypothetical protein
LSGLKKYSDARVQAQALKELSQSFQSEVAPQVVDVEGRTLRLTGTAEEQYREWRELLQQFYNEENGVATASLPAGVVPATSDVDAAAGASGTAIPGVTPVAPPANKGAASKAAAPNATTSAPASSAKPAATPSSNTTTAPPSNKLAPSQSGSATAPANKSAPATAPVKTQATPISGTVPAPKAAPGVEALPASKVAPATSSPTTSLYRYPVRSAA